MQYNIIIQYIWSEITLHCVLFDIETGKGKRSELILKCCYYTFITRSVSACHKLEIIIIINHKLLWLKIHVWRKTKRHALNLWNNPQYIFKKYRIITFISKLFSSYHLKLPEIQKQMKCSPVYYTANLMLCIDINVVLCHVFFL